MKTRMFVAGLAVTLLTGLFGGASMVAAQGPDFDPDAYTVSLVDSGAADMLAAGAPAELNLVATFDSDPDAYTVSIDQPEAAPVELNLVGTFDADPDAYTVSIEDSGAADLNVTAGGAAPTQIIWTYDQDTDTWMPNVISASPEGSMWVAPYES